MAIRTERAERDAVLGRRKKGTVLTIDSEKRNRDGRKKLRNDCRRLRKPKLIGYLHKAEKEIGRTVARNGMEAGCISNYWAVAQGGRSKTDWGYQGEGGSPAPVSARLDVSGG